jgi:hypothetical protein
MAETFVVHRPADECRKRVGEALGAPSGASAVEVETDVDHHTFRIATGFHGAIGSPPPEVAAETRPLAPIKTLYVPTGSCTASCCD